MSGRRLLLAMLAAGVAQAGWATIDPHDWHEQPAHPPMQPYHVTVDAAHLNEVCRDHRRVLGCAVRMPQDRVCIIYTPKNPAAWVLEHERRHCAGYDHA